MIEFNPYVPLLLALTAAVPFTPPFPSPRHSRHLPSAIAKAMT